MNASRMRRPFRRAHRDVLQVGIGRREPAGHRRRLPERRVHAAGVRVHHLRQLVGVRGLELRQRAMLEQDFRQRIVGGELLQHVLVGRRLPGRRLLHHRQLHLVEQDLAQLLRRPEVERLAGELIRLLLEREHALAELAALRARAAPASIMTPSRSMRNSTSRTGISMSRRCARASGRRRRADAACDAAAA